MRLAIDGSVLFLYFFGIVGLGLWAGRKNADLKDFALGGRSIPWWAVLASIIAAETSAATFLGTPGEGYKTRAYVYGQLAIGTILARIIVAFTFIKPYYQYRVESVYEFLLVRFGPMTRNGASAIFLITRVLGMGVRLYLGGVILVVIWRYLFPGVQITLATYFWGIVFVTLLTTIYTAAGGIKAVVWTDLIQALLMMSCMVFAIVMLIRGIPGGLSGVRETMGGWANIRVIETGLHPGYSLGQTVMRILGDPYTIFGALIGSTFLTMSTHGIDQDMVQRMLTATNYKKSRLSLILSGLADLPLAFCFMTIGILLYVYYQRTPDAHLPRADNEIFAYYIINTMPVGIRGLIVAGVFATMMGSTSAALNALATSFTKDFYLPYINPQAGDRASIRAARIATAVFGSLMVVVATVVADAVLHHPKLTIIPIALGVLSYTYGALLGVFLVGMLTRTRGADRTNAIAMALGIVTVLIAARIVITGVPHLDEQNGKLMVGPSHIAFIWYIVIGTVVTGTFALLFRTPESQLSFAKAHVENQKSPGRP